MLSPLIFLLSVSILSFNGAIIELYYISILTNRLYGGVCLVNVVRENWMKNALEFIT